MIPVASLAWSSLNTLHRKAYDWGVLKAQRLPCRVLSIGNLQAGGAGKTPFTIFVAQEAVRRGLQVCILTRGYKSEWEKKGGVLEPFRKGPSAQVCGDEPALMHEKVPEAWIGVGADRIQQFEAVCQRFGKTPDLVILDDGFQKLKIHRDLDIVLVTSHLPKDFFFREFPATLQRAPLRVWTKGYTRPEGINIRARFEIPPNPRPETRFMLITGIADPDELLIQLKANGYQVETEWRLTDHEIPSRETYASQLVMARRRSLTLLMTGKDHMKFRDHMETSEFALPPVVIEPEVRILEGAETWNRLLWG